MSERVVDEWKARSEMAKPDKPPELIPINVAMADDQIQQRWIAKRVFREAEVRTIEFTGEETIGFITGLDSGSIQMSVTVDPDSRPYDVPKSVLVPRFGTKLEETGRRLNNYPFETRDRIREWCFALKQTCRYELQKHKHLETEIEEATG